jgi:hypothetical protein
MHGGGSQARGVVVTRPIFASAVGMRLTSALFSIFNISANCIVG